MNGRVRVSLLRQTADPEIAVALAARLCYSPDGIDDLERGADAAGAAASDPPDRRPRPSLGSRARRVQLRHRRHLPRGEPPAGAPPRRLLFPAEPALRRRERGLRARGPAVHRRPAGARAPVRPGDAGRRQAVPRAAGGRRARRGRALRAPQRGGHPHHRHDERPRAAALLHAALLPARAVGDSRRWRSACSAWPGTRPRCCSRSAAPRASRGPAPRASSPAAASREVRAATAAGPPASRSRAWRRVGAGERRWASR